MAQGSDAHPARHFGHGEGAAGKLDMEKLHELLMSDSGFHFFGRLDSLSEGSFSFSPYKPDFAPDWIKRDLPGSTQVMFDGDTRFMDIDGPADSSILSEGKSYAVLGRRQDGGVLAILVGDEDHVRDHLQQMQQHAGLHMAHGHPYIGKLTQSGDGSLGIVTYVPAELEQLREEHGLQQLMSEGQAMSFIVDGETGFGLPGDDADGSSFSVGDVVVVFPAADDEGRAVQVLGYDAAREHLHRMLQMHLKELEQHSN